MDTMHHHTTTASAEHGYSELMSLALDGLLAPEDAQRFDRHREACPACQTEWAKWQRIAHVLHVEPFAGPPQGFALRVDQAMQRDEQRQERILGGLMLTGGALTVTAAVALSVLFSAALWMALAPAARLMALEFIGFARQLAELVFLNLTSLRDAVLSLLPNPLAMLVMALALVAAGMIWARLVFFSGRVRAGNR